MSSEETPKKPRKPRAPKKTAGRVDSVPASAPIPDNGIRQKPPVEGSNNLYFVHPADYHDDDDSVVNRIEPTEVVSSASAPMTEKDDRQTETEGKDVAADPSLQPDSFPPPLTDSRETDSGTQGTDSDANVVQGIPQSTADEPDSFPPQTTSESTKTDSAVGNDSNSTTQATADENEKNMGNDRSAPATADSNRDSEVLESLAVSRVRIPGETKSACKERLRMLARNAGLPRGTGPGTAYEWAMNAVIELFAPPPIPPAPVSIEETKETAIPEPEILSPIGYKSPQVDDPIPVSAPVIEPDVPGLGTIPESWPKLPPNAPLQAEIAWVTANRLVVRSGKGVDLSRALSPAPSYSALSWLETSILFPSKFADISVKATADQDTEKEFVRREKMAIEEIRSLLAEMLDAKTTQSK